MRWVRTKKRSGSWRALAAMALQLVVSFGHLHPDRNGSTPTTVTIAGATSSGHPTFPTQYPSSDANDYCAICAIIQLTSTSFMPEAPPLLVPFTAQVVHRFSSIVLIGTTPRHTAFQSRAPPLV